MNASMEKTYYDIFADNVITKDFLDCLKKAVGLMVTFQKVEGENSRHNVTVQIKQEVKLNKEEIDYWHKFEKSFTGYGSYNHVSEQYPKSAYFHRMYCKDDGTFQALCQIARPGDILTWEFRENNNGYLEKAGLHHDELLISITRPNSNGGRKIINRLVMDWQTTPDNSARAVRY